MLLTVKQFSDQQKISIRTVYDHIERNILPFQKIGSTYLIDSDSLPEYQQNLVNLDKIKELTGGKPRK